MEIDLKRYVTALKKRLWIAVIIAISAGVSAGMYTIKFTPSYYAATTKLIVNKTVNVFGGQEMDDSSIGTSIKLIDTYKEIILTPAIMDKVVQRNPDLGLSANDLIGMVTVNSLNGTQVMTVTAVDTRYVRAARAVNAVSDVFRTEIPKIMKIDNITILTEAKENEPTQPFGQNLKLNVAVAFAVALMLSIGWVILLEYLDSSFKTEEDIWQTLGVPSFAAIPRMKKKDFRHKSVKQTSKTMIQAGEQTV